MMVYGCTHDAPESNDEHLFVEVGNKLLCNNSGLQFALDAHGTHFDVARNDGGADGDKQIRLRHGYCEHIRFTHSFLAQKHSLAPATNILTCMLLSTAATACGVNFKQARPKAFRKRRLYMRSGSNMRLVTPSNGYT